MKPLAVAALALCLIAATCETRPDPPPLVKSAPSTSVDMPVHLPCVDAKDIPEPPPPPTVGPDANVGNRLAAIKAYILKATPQTKQLRATALGCSTPKEGP